MDMNKKISLGTTTIAFHYKDGLLCICDSRTSSDTMIANRVQRKLVKLTNKIAVLVSGSAADTRFLCRQVRSMVDQHELELGAPALVKTVAGLFALYNYKYKQQLLAGLLVCGHDETGYHCYKVIPGGTMIEEKMVMSGSGSTYVYGLADSEYRPDMTKEEALQFGQKLIQCAVRRDGSSGGVARWCFVENGTVVGEHDNWLQVE